MTAKQEAIAKATAAFDAAQELTNTLAEVLLHIQLGEDIPAAENSAVRKALTDIRKNIGAAMTLNRGI